MGGIWHSWFGWPNGSVLTNLVASLIGLIVGLSIPAVKLFRKMDAIHDQSKQNADHLIRLHERLGPE